MRWHELTTSSHSLIWRCFLFVSANMCFPWWDLTPPPERCGARTASKWRCYRRHCSLQMTLCQCLPSVRGACEVKADIPKWQKSTSCSQSTFAKSNVRLSSPVNYLFLLERTACAKSLWPLLILDVRNFIFLHRDCLGLMGNGSTHTSTNIWSLSFILNFLFACEPTDIIFI